MESPTGEVLHVCAQASHALPNGHARPYLPYGLKSLDLLNRKGYEVEDKHLASREQTDAFKKEHGIETTPQVFINGRRVGGYDDLRKFFGMSVKDKNAVT